MKKQDNDAHSRQALVVWALLSHPVSDGRNDNRSQEEILPGMKSWENRTNHDGLEPHTLLLGDQLQGWSFSYSIWWIILCCVVYILQALDLTFLLYLLSSHRHCVWDPFFFPPYFCLSFPPFFCVVVFVESFYLVHAGLKLIIPFSASLSAGPCLVCWLVFCQLYTNLDVSGKREFQMRNCFHQITL